LIGLKQFTVDSYERLLACKYFSKEEVLQEKIILEIQLIENKEVTLLVQLNR